MEEKKEEKIIVNGVEVSQEELEKMKESQDKNTTLIQESDNTFIQILRD